MEPTTQSPSERQTRDLESPNTQQDLLERLHSPQPSYHVLQTNSSLIEEDLIVLQHQRDQALNHNSHLEMRIHHISVEKDSVRDQLHEFEVSFKQKQQDFAKRMDEELSRIIHLEKELVSSRERNKTLEFEMKKLKEKNGLLLDSLRSVKDSLLKIIESFDDEKMTESVKNDENCAELELRNGSTEVWEEFLSIIRLASEAESKVNDFKERKKIEKRELENSVVSLTEENRDINSLLRVALVEKETVEKTMSKLKGDPEQKRGTLLQIAERGLQRVGFGFIMASGSPEPSIEGSGACTSTTTASTKSDSGECEEELVTVASTVERITKNLRLEITQLRRCLEESRSDAERLQSVTEKQAEEIAENRVCINELEDREKALVQNVGDLLTEIKESAVEVSRWREACEMEVEAGRKEIEERDKVIMILKQELEKTKASLDVSNGKLKLKEELAATAMVAQATAERSLQLIDSRAARYRDQIEELMKQLEEIERRERSHVKVWRICWPWSTFKMNPTSSATTRVRSTRRMLADMQTLLHYPV